MAKNKNHPSQLTKKEEKQKQKQIDKYNSLTDKIVGKLDKLRDLAEEMGSPIRTVTYSTLEDGTRKFRITCRRQSSK